MMNLNVIHNRSKRRAALRKSHIIRLDIRLQPRGPNPSLPA